MSYRSLSLLLSTQTRARLSFKRRPPTRQHRRSAGEEAGGFGSAPCEQCSPKENGDEDDQVFASPEEEAEHRQRKEAEEKDRDCDKTEDEVAKSDKDDRGDPEEEQQRQQKAEQAQNLETLEEEQQPSEACPAMQIEGSKTEEAQEETPQGELKAGSDGV